MYAGGVTFFINKSFASMQLIPEPSGLRISYIPIVNGTEDTSDAGYLDMVIPLDAVGGIWSTARAFLYAVESLDENIILQGDPKNNEDADILIKLYRDKPKGENGKLSGEETCWIRLVTGRSEEERRRIKLGPRDLLSIELACSSVLSVSAAKGTHAPKKS